MKFLVVTKTPLGIMNRHSTFYRVGPFSWILVLSVLLLAFTGCSSQRTIVNRLDEREANEILVFLNNHNIEATKSVSPTAGGGGGGQQVVQWDINVPSDKAIDAMALLNANGLPRRRGQNLLNIFTGAGLVPSDVEQKIRYQQGLAEQIASVIRKIDGVLDAEVQLSFPEEDTLNPLEKKGKVTASVYVKHNGVLDDPNLHLVTKIKRLVASSVPGLNYDDVTVIGDLARPEPGNEITSANAEAQNYVSIWTIVLAKSSVGRFQLIFFSLCALTLILSLLLIWVIWKLYPLLHTKGGLKQFFNLHPLHLEEGKAEDVKAVEVKPKEKKEESSVEGEGSDTDQRT
jgi:type III secretion protein J